MYVKRQSNIKGDSGVKVNNLGGGNIGHCEKEVNMNKCPVLNGYWDRDVKLQIKKKKLWMEIKKEKVLIVNFILILI